MAPLTAGTILDRRFRLTVPLGQPAVASGTGPVWRATELSTGAEVAVKVLTAHLADIVGLRLTGTGPMVAMAASSRPAPRPAVRAVRWPG